MTNMTMSNLPQPDMKKALPHCDNYIDALIDEALDDLAEIKNEASNTADRLSDELLRGANHDNR